MAEALDRPARSPDTDEIVRKLLLARKGQWRRIAEQSRVVSYSWITKFMGGEIPNAGSDTLKKLRRWLEAHPIAGQQQVPAPPAAITAGGNASPSSTDGGAISEPPGG